MATIVTDILCDLTQPVKVQYLHGNLFSQDNAANTINVHVHSAGVPESLGGTISANVIRSDGGTVAVAGSVSGDTATVVLPQACYAVPGVIHIIIKSTVSSVVTTIAAVVANVYTSSTDTVIDPGTIITDVAALIDAIEDAVDSIPVDYSGLLATIAADYSSSKTYPVVGTYAWQGGVLKRNIVPITTAESYTAAHWTNAVLGDDVSALKSALYAYDGTKTVEYSSLPTYSGGFMNQDGTVSSGSGHKIVSMSAEGVKKIDFTLVTALSGGLVIGLLKDAEGNVVSYKKSMTAQTSFEWEIPSGYDNGTIYFNWFNYASQTYLNEASVSLTITKFTEKADIQSLKGKTVYAFGDSIVVGYTSGTTTTQNNFVKIFCDKVGATLTNYGIASSCFTSGYNSTKTIVEKIQETNLSGADILLIAGGVNDCQLGVTESDFSSAISALTTWLASNFDGIVIFVLPINFSKTFSEQINDIEIYRNYIRLYGTTNNYIVITTTDYGFPKGTTATQTSLAQTLFGDGLHPTELGHELYGESLAKDLNVILKH